MPCEADVQFLTKICSTRITSNECSSEVFSLLNSPSNIALAKSLRRPEAQRLIDFLDFALALSRLDVNIWLRGLRLIRKVSGTLKILPSSYILPEECVPIGEVRIDRRSTVVTDGTYQGRTVAIKCLNVNGRDSDRIFKLFCREVVAWKHLSHRNILPLLGVYISPDTRCLRILTEWMDNGNVMQYASSNPKANRLQLLAQVTRAVIYLHDLKIVHGDLKGANILVDNKGAALLTDFGLMALTDLSTFLSETASSSEGTFRWMSPELLDPSGFGSDGRPTRESDRYALGMVIYEVLTGLVPFHNMTAPTFIPPVVRGRRPERPPQAEKLGLSKILWGLVQSCWSAETSSRPTAHELSEQLSLDSLCWDPPEEYPMPVSDASSSDSSGSSHGSLVGSTREA